MIIESQKTPETRLADQQRRQSDERRSAELERDKAKALQATLPSYTAADLAVAYSQNSVAADQIFKGKKYKIFGVVESINTDLFGNPYLTLRGGVNQFMEPQFKFGKGASERLSSLRKGAGVGMICVGKGDVAKTPMSGDCILL